MNNEEHIEYLLEQMSSGREMSREQLETLIDYIELLINKDTKKEK